MDVTPVNLIVFAYFAVLIGFGLYGFLKNRVRSTSTMEKDFIGDRSYDFATLLVSLVAVWGSNYTLIAAAQSGYQSGISGVIWYALGIFLPLVLFSWPLNIPGRVKELFPDGLTLVEILGKRYDEKTRVATLSILFIANVLFIISIVLALGLVVKALLGTSLDTAIIIGGVVMIIYTSLGGFEALLYSRIFQLALAGSAVGVAIILSVNEFSLSGFVEQLSYSQEAMLNPVAWGPAKMLAFSISTVGFVFGSPILYQIALSAKNRREATLAFRLFPFAWAPFAVGTAIMGVAAFFLFPGIEGQEAAVTLVNHIFPEWASLLFFLGALALVFSTADGAINNLASIFVFDIYKKVAKHDVSQRQGLMLSTIIIVLLGTVGIIGAINIGENILSLLVLNGIILLPLVFVIVLGLFWRRAHSSSAFWALIVGITLILILYYGFDKSVFTSYVGLVVPFIILTAGSWFFTSSETDYLAHIENEGKK